MFTNRFDETVAVEEHKALVLVDNNNLVVVAACYQKLKKGQPGYQHSTITNLETFLRENRVRILLLKYLQ